MDALSSLCVCVCVLCCVQSPRCRISMWEHEATAVTLTSAAVEDKRLFTLAAEAILSALLLPQRKYLKQNPAGQNEHLLLYESHTVQVTQAHLIQVRNYPPLDERQ